MSTQSILSEGTSVTIVRQSVSGDADIDAAAAKVGGEYIVEAYAGPNEGDDPNGRGYYLLDIEYMSLGGAYWAYPEDIQVNSTAEERQATRYAEQDAVTLPALVAAIARASLSMSNELVEVTECDASANDGTARISGNTPSGAYFTAVIAVDSIEFS